MERILKCYPIAIARAMDHNYPYPNLVTVYPPFLSFLCISLSFYFILRFFFLYLATENKKEGDKFIPVSLLVLCVSVKLCLMVITNQLEKAGLLPGL